MSSFRPFSIIPRILSSLVIFFHLVKWLLRRIFSNSKINYNFRNAETLNTSNLNSVNYGTETITSLSAKI